MDSNTEKIISLFDKPKVISLCADRNTGKSNTIAHIIETLRSTGANFNLRTYGLPEEFEQIENNKPVHSLEQLEEIKDSVIILDEAAQLLDVENRQKKTMIEEFIRLINHQNNVVIMCLLPENIKKFLANKVQTYIFKKTTIGDCINGSYSKKVVTSYAGKEKGSYVLSIPIDEALVWDGKEYFKIDVPYWEKYDVKKNNKPIVEFPNEVKHNVS